MMGKSRSQKIVIRWWRAKVGSDYKEQKYLCAAEIEGKNRMNTSKMMILIKHWWTTVDECECTEIFFYELVICIHVVLAKIVKTEFLFIGVMKLYPDQGKSLSPNLPAEFQQHQTTCMTLLTATTSTTHPRPVSTCILFESLLDYKNSKIYT